MLSCPRCVRTYCIMCTRVNTVHWQDRGYPSWWARLLRRLNSPILRKLSSPLFFPFQPAHKSHSFNNASFSSFNSPSLSICKSKQFSPSVKANNDSRQRFKIMQSLACSTSATLKGLKSNTHPLCTFHTLNHHWQFCYIFRLVRVVVVVIVQFLGMFASTFELEGLTFLPFQHQQCQPYASTLNARLPTSCITPPVDFQTPMHESLPKHEPRNLFQFQISFLQNPHA